MSDPAVYLPQMARIGMPGPMLRFCYEMLQRGDRMDDLDYTFGPLVVHGDPKLLDNILPRYKLFVYEERLQILFGQLPDHVVSPTEIMLVMHNAVLWGGGPPSYQMSEIYLWASAWAVEKANPTPSVKETMKDMPTWQDVMGRYSQDYHAIAGENPAHRDPPRQKLAQSAKATEPPGVILGVLSVWSLRARAPICRGGGGRPGAGGTSSGPPSILSSSAPWSGCCVMPSSRAASGCCCTC